MRTQPSTSLDSSSVALRLGMCAAALAGTAATVSDADAAVITFSAPIPIPANTSGIYLNFLTGATGSLGSAVAGWDFNPYLANVGTQLGFYWAATAGGVATAATGGVYLDLAPGASVSSSSVFARTILATTASPFLTTGTHTLGFKFINESTGVLNFGYLTMTNTGTNGFPATITGWSFDNTGAAITVTPVPEPASALMLSVGALALGAAQLRRIRRYKREQQIH